MENQPILDQIDPDLAEHLGSRRDAVRSAGKLSAGLALGSVPVALGVLARAASGQSSGLPASIVAVLNFALTLEELEAEFYRLGLATTNLIPTQFRPVFQTISDHENAHVALLRSVLGSQAVAKPTFRFNEGPYGNVLRSFGVYADVAQLFEDTGVRAYKGQAGNLMSNDMILTTALRIHSVEARHAAEVRIIRGQKPVVGGVETMIFGGASVYAREDQTVQLGVNVPQVAGVPVYSAHEAFDEPLTMEEVLAIADPFIV